MSTGRLEIRRGRDKLGRRRWYTRIIASNGRILAHSEALNSRAAAVGNIEAIRACLDAPMIDITRETT